MNERKRAELYNYVLYECNASDLTLFLKALKLDVLELYTVIAPL